MATLRIEMDRGMGWEVRGEGQVPDDITDERVREEVDRYCLQYPHRGFLNGRLVHEGKPQIKRRRVRR